jgi:hypothetical protein
MRGIPSLIQRLLGRWSQAYQATRARARFPNVPDKLTVFVRDHMTEYKRTGDRNLLYLEAAGGVIRQYTGIYAFSGETDPYLKAEKINQEGGISYVFPLRVLLMGETLFLLRSCDGFDDMCRRLKEQRDLRSAFYELRVARIFFDAGFNINVRPEINKLGEDFDFEASQRDLKINVEVTALKEKEFYEETAFNALDRKENSLLQISPRLYFVYFHHHGKPLFQI